MRIEAARNLMLLDIDLLSLPLQVRPFPADHIDHLNGLDDGSSYDSDG